MSEHISEALGRVQRSIDLAVEPHIGNRPFTAEAPSHFMSVRRISSRSSVNSSLVPGPESFFGGLDDVVRNWLTEKMAGLDGNYFLMSPYWAN